VGHMPTRRTIGVDIGGTRLLAGAVDAELGVHHRTQRAVSGLDHASLLTAAIDAIEETRDAAGAEIAAIGFAQSTDAPPEFADVMAERLGLPAFADGRANVIALAEQRAGAARGVREVLVLTIGEEINAAVILGGELQRQRIEVGDASSLAAALSEARAAVEPAHDGDQAAIRSVEALGRALGDAIARLGPSLRPQLIVVAGPVVAAGRPLLAAIRRGNQAPVVTARFGVDGAMIGAGVLAFERVRRRGAQAA
jgi:glucokinase